MNMNILFSGAKEQHLLLTIMLMSVICMIKLDSSTWILPPQNPVVPYGLS